MNKQTPKETLLDLLLSIVNAGKNPSPTQTKIYIDDALKLLDEWYEEKYKDIITEHQQTLITTGQTLRNYKIQLDKLKSITVDEIEAFMHRKGLPVRGDDKIWYRWIAEGIHKLIQER